MKKIFHYTNYRTYLKDYYEYHKEHTTYFSFRYFSNRAGFGSPSMLKFIINGERNLSDEAVEKCVPALKLKGKEAEYFRALVHFNQAKTEKQKDRYFTELTRITAGAGFKKVVERQYEFYADWHNAAVRELVALDDFVEDYRALATRLNPRVTPSQVKRSIELMLELGFLRRKKNGQLVQSAPVITTGDEVTSQAVRQFHRQMISLAGESIERYPKERREVSGLTMAFSDACFTRLKDRIQAFENELLEMVEQDNEPAEHVYQLNFQLFPLAQETKTKR